MPGDSQTLIQNFVVREIAAFGIEVSQARHWQSLLNTVQDAFFGNLFATAIGMMVFLLGSVCYQRLLWFSDRTVKNAIRDEHISSLDSSRLFLSTLMASILCWSPLLAIGCFLRWNAANSISADFQFSVGAGLIAVFLVAVTFRLVQEFFSQGGLSEAIYGMKYSTARYVLNQLELTVFLVTPLIFTFVFVSCFAEGHWYDSVGRISFLLMSVLLFSQFQKLCWPGSKLYQRLELDAASSDSGWVRHRVVTYVIGVAIFLLAVGLTISGWFELAKTLSINSTLTLFLGVLAFSLRTIIGQKATELIRRENLIEDLGHSADSTISVRSPRVREFVQRYSQTANRGVGFVTTLCFLVASYWIWRDWISLPPELLKIRIGGVALAGLVVVGKLLVIGLTTYYVARELPAFAQWCFRHQTKLEIGNPVLASKLISATIAYGGILLAARSIEFEFPAIPWLGTLLTISLLYAARNFVSDGFAGTVLLFDSRIAVGDSIEVAGRYGRVAAVNWFTTLIEDNLGTTNIVPNSAIIAQAVIKTRDLESIPMLIEVSLPRDSDAYQAQAVMMLVVQRDPAVVLQPPPHVRFVEFRTSELRFEIRLLVLSSSNFEETKLRINEKLAMEFERHGISLPAGGVAGRRNSVRLSETKAG